MTWSSSLADVSEKKNPHGAWNGILYTGLKSQGEVLSTEGSFGDAGVDSWPRFRKHAVPLYPPNCCYQHLPSRCVRHVLNWAWMRSLFGPTDCVGNKKTVNADC